MTETKRILGVDPGTNFLGFAILSVQLGNPHVIDLGTLKLTYVKDNHLKLHKIYVSIRNLIRKYAIDEMAIEAPFYGKNVQSMLKLGRAQGVAMAAGMAHELKITEYPPKKIKLSITGNGNASKEQVSAMLGHILNFQISAYSLDATDALATALCHHYNQSSAIQTNGKTYSDWSSFVKDNPDRIKT